MITGCDSLKDAIGKRQSVRSYEKRPLTYEDEETVRTILEEAQKKEGPFGHQARFFASVNKIEDEHKTGTYGFIKHAPMYVGGVVKNTYEALVDYGFLFEEAILRITAEEIGTVWLGGPFDDDDFDVKTHWHEVIPAISPVGYPAKDAMRETLDSGVVGSRRRMPPKKLFFEGESLSPVSEDHRHMKYLDALREAPSASNKQPWRVVLKDDAFHLYLERDGAYTDRKAMDMQAIDAGIALSHLHLTLVEDGYTTGFEHDKPFDFDGAEYVMSVTATKRDER